MRKIVAISALSVLAAGATAAGFMLMRAPQESMTADLERDLSLASSVQAKRTGFVSPIEQGGTGAPSGNEKGKRAPVVTQRRAPSAAPSRLIADVAVTPTTETPAPAPAAPTAVEPVEPTVATPEPSVNAPTPDGSGVLGPVATGGPSAGGSGNGDNGMDTRGSGRTGSEVPPATREPPSGPSTVIGVIMRGGSPGHDNCEPGGRRRGDNTNAVGMIGAIGGVILNGGGAPRGSLPGGNRGGRRW